MLRFVSNLLCFILALGCGGFLAQSALPTRVSLRPISIRTDEAKKLVAYYTDWAHQDGFRLDVSHAKHVTHLIYSFVTLTPEGSCQFPKVKSGTVPDAIQHLKLFQIDHPQIKLLLAVGGWGGSDYFSRNVNSAQKRDALVKSCVQIMQDAGFQGIDLDWEYPVEGGLLAAEPMAIEKVYFEELVKEFRKQLGPRGGKASLLSIAVPAATTLLKNYHFQGIAASLDWITVMGYDLADKDSPRTAHHAPLYLSKQDSNKQTSGLSADEAVRYLVKKQVPSYKVILGVPFYGHIFYGVSDKKNGLNQTHQPDLSEIKTMGYADILKNYESTTTRFFDAVARSPWRYSKKTKTWITYEDPTSLAMRAQYVMDKKLGGVAVWELAQDTKNNSLLQALKLPQALSPLHK